MMRSVASLPRWARLVAIGGLVLVLAAAGAWYATDRSSEDDARFCAGVGFTGPAAATADEALRRWLELQPGEPPFEAWDRTGAVAEHPTSGRRSVTYESDDSAAYQDLSVSTGGLDPEGSRLGDDEWMVDGACVRSPSS